MASCDYCGKEFGNAGAAASHENACDEKPETEAPQQASPNQQQAQQQPQRAEGQQQAQPPAQQQASMEDGLAAGQQVGEVVSGINSGDPEQQAQAEGQLAAMLGSAVARAGANVAKSKLQGITNARNTSSDQLTKSEQYPDCPECGAQITQMPDGGEFPCPNCDVMLRVD